MNQQGERSTRSGSLTRTRLLPAAIGAVLLLITAGLFYELRSIESQELTRTLNSRADGIQQIAEAEFSERISAIRRLAHRTAQDSALSPADWHSRESGYLDDFPGLVSLELVELSEDGPQTLATASGEESGAELSGELLRLLREGKLSSEKVALRENNSGLIWILEPVRDAGSPDRAVVAAISVSSFLNAIPHWTRLGHRFSVQGPGGEQFFSDREDAGADTSGFRVERELNLGEAVLTATVTPAEAQIRRVRTYLPFTALVMGVLLSLLAAVAVALWQRAKSRERRLQELNRELETEASRRENVERDLERSNKQLKEFAYITSHDLQEPLRSVKSFADLLEKRYRDELPDEAREFLDFITEGASRMKTLINDILQLSRVQRAELDLEVFPAEEAVQHALDSLHTAINESDAEIEIGDLPEVQADRQQLSLVFQNLISNGLKFHHEGENPEMKVSAIKDEEKWTFSVLDNGIGIEAEYQEKIFQAFQRLHDRSEYQGTGIGLAICRQIVERHDGTIRVESEPGEGSEFSFTISRETSSHGS